MTAPHRLLHHVATAIGALLCLVAMLVLTLVAIPVALVAGLLRPEWWDRELRR